MQRTILQIQKRIKKIKQELLKIEDMRPGALTRQYKFPKEKKGGFYQISYTHKMKSRTEYVRPEFVKKIKKEIANYKKFKKLTQEWIEKAIELSKLNIKITIDSL